MREPRVGLWVVFKDAFGSIGRGPKKIISISKGNIEYSNGSNASVEFFKMNSESYTILGYGYQVEEDIKKWLKS